MKKVKLNNKLEGFLGLENGYRILSKYLKYTVTWSRKYANIYIQMRLGMNRSI